MIKIGLVEDEQIIRDNLALFFSNIPSFEMSFNLSSMEELLVEPLLHDIDILLLDIGLPKMTGLEGIRPIKQKVPDVKSLYSLLLKIPTIFSRHFVLVQYLIFPRKHHLKELNKDCIPYIMVVHICRLLLPKK